MKRSNHTLLEKQAVIRAAKKHYSYTELESQYGVNRKWLHDIVNKDAGDIRLPPSVAARLGIAQVIEVPACPECGEAHIKKTCTAKRKGRARLPLLVSLGLCTREEREAIMMLSPQERKEAILMICKEVLHD